MKIKTTVWRPDWITHEILFIMPPNKIGSHFMSDITQSKEYQAATCVTQSIFGDLPVPPPRRNPRYTDQQILLWGYVFWRELEDGTVLGVLPMTFGRGRICGGLDPLGYAEYWTYEHLPDAIAALKAWEPDNAPEKEGWVYHFPTRRRRIDGDPSTEHVQ
jgi:hypothetical protein